MRYLRWYGLCSLVLALVLSGCNPTRNGPGPKTVLGGMGGAAGGGLIGAAVGGGDAKTIAAGTILGLLVGGAVGDRMDAADRKYAAKSTQEALEYAPVGQRVQWTNPDSRNRGYVMPMRTYQTANGGYCREFQHVLTIGGKKQDAYGTACRQEDGTWKVQ